MPVEEKVIVEEKKEPQTEVDKEEMKEPVTETDSNEGKTNPTVSAKVSLDEEISEDETQHTVNQDDQITEEKDNIDEPATDLEEKTEVLNNDQPETEQKIDDEPAKSDLEEDAKNETEIEHVENNQMQPEKAVAGFSLFYTFIMLIFAIASVCVLLSCYYRFHLIKNKRAPFNAPRSLKPLFPTPVNYEFEISELCNKYMAQ